MLGIDTQSFVLLKRGFWQGIDAVRRDRGSMTALGVLFGVMVVLQLLFLIGAGTQAVTQVLRSQMELRLEILPSAKDTDIQTLFGALRALPSVETVSYVTKEQAYERERTRDASLISFLEQFNLQNPFPDTFAVTLKDLGDFDAFASFIKDPQWASVVDPAFLSKATTQEQEAHELLRLTSVGRTVIFLFLALMAVVLLLVLVEFVRRRALERREDILVHRLAGADGMAILVPFITESAFLFTVALLLSFLLLLGILFVLPFFAPWIFEGGIGLLASRIHDSLQVFLPLLFVAELVAIPLLSYLGTWWGTRPFLREAGR